MRQVLVLMAALIATPVGAEVIECPDGTSYDVADPLTAPCVELCSDRSWIVLGRDSCPPGAQVLDTTDGVMDLIGEIEAEVRPFDSIRLRNSALGLLAMLAGLGVYLAPSFIARARRHPRTLEIVLVDVLLGWTAIGWVAALLWSLREADPQHDGAAPIA
ncbi:MAG: superinfection immunity protein [Myxococcota bacterium]